MSKSYGRPWNVFYELGVRHALRSGTVLIAEQGTVSPFDTSELRVVGYFDRLGERRRLSRGFRQC